MHTTLMRSNGTPSPAQTTITDITVKHNPRTGRRVMVLDYQGGTAREIALSAYEAMQLAKLLGADCPEDEFRTVGRVVHGK